TEDLRVIGDTTIAALTEISSDPFSTLNSIAEATAKKNNPTIKLQIILNPTSDPSHLLRYMIHDVIVYPDLSGKDLLSDSSFIKDTARGFEIRYHKKLFKKGFL